MGSGTRTRNFSISGTVLHQALADQLPAALAADPDVVTVWLSVNDFAARVPLEIYQADLDSMLQQLSGTRARVLVGNLPDLSAVPAFGTADPSALKAEVNRWNRAIADSTARNGASLIDLHSYWAELAAHPEYVAGDGFHPSAPGYKRIADLFYQAYVSP